MRKTTKEIALIMLGLSDRKSYKQKHTFRYYISSFQDTQTVQGQNWNISFNFPMAVTMDISNSVGNMWTNYWRKLSGMGFPSNPIQPTYIKVIIIIMIITFDFPILQTTLPAYLSGQLHSKAFASAVQCPCAFPRGNTEILSSPGKKTLESYRGNPVGLWHKWPCEVHTEYHHGNSPKLHTSRNLHVTPDRVTRQELLLAFSVFFVPRDLVTFGVHTTVNQNLNTRWSCFSLTSYYR